MKLFAWAAGRGDAGQASMPGPTPSVDGMLLAPTVASHGHLAARCCSARRRFSAAQIKLMKEISSAQMSCRSGRTPAASRAHGASDRPLPLGARSCPLAYLSRLSMASRYHSRNPRPRCLLDGRVRYQGQLIHNVVGVRTLPSVRSNAIWARRFTMRTARCRYAIPWRRCSG